jgi:hypothetical protein
MAHHKYLELSDMPPPPVLTPSSIIPHLRAVALLFTQGKIRRVLEKCYLNFFTLNIACLKFLKPKFCMSVSVCCEKGYVINSL